MRERTQLSSAIDTTLALERELADAVGLIELAEEEGDQSLVTEGADQLVALQGKARKKALEALLSGEADSNDTYLEVHAGAGGTESQDWALMLARMYARWAERRKFKVEWIEESAGEEAGLKSATLLIKGPNAYGWLKTEAGVHRLVRISPFDSIQIEIPEKDVRIDTFRASGAGGQHVNRTDSAVRITHIPTNIVVSCQAERSQHKNRATAWKMLRARLYEAELKKREEAAAAAAASKTDISWGHQIRSYVLQPYQMVKDLRTGVTRTDPSVVLDGDIDDFIEASLAARIEGKGQAPVADLD